ncbi:MAG: hypothetical protein JWP93_2326 [Polaromonas sp.]|nr:hypothetical protein [Polaromonas sp.]
MPKLERRITDSMARALPTPLTGYELHWCPSTPGFGVRVSATGDHAYISERRVDGKTKRRTLGKATGPGAISADVARKLQITISGELQTGVDRSQLTKTARKVEATQSKTLAVALAEYVKLKRRAKDGLPLTLRTRTDYMDMLKQGGISETGEPFANGYLYPLASKPIHKITAQQIRDLYEDLNSTRSERGATYAMQVLRAVLNWHGTQIPDSPLNKTTAGRDRIILPQTKGDPKPIPPERLGAWWRAATALKGNVGADGLRFMLLTGCRPGEVFGNPQEPEGLRVRDVNLEGARIFLEETKNRASHTILLSAQMVDILRPYCEGRKADSKVFDVLDPGKTLIAINKAAGVPGITRHKLRHTFASVADELVSSYSVKRMLNHISSADVTGASYIGKSETQLRNAWQTVADFIVAA